MFNKTRQSKTTYGIVGLGRFGSALALELIRSGAEILVVDHDEEKIREMREYTENAFVAHSYDKKALAETGIQNCDVAIVCIGEHLDTSILTTLNLVGMKIPLVIAKANSPEHGEILEKLGADVVYPEKDMAIRLANRLEASSVIDFIQLSERINISKLHIPKCIVGKSVLEVNLRHNFGLNIIAVENKGSVIEYTKPDYIFRNEDILILCGSKEGIYALNKWVEKQ